MTPPVFRYEVPFELPDVLVDVDGKQLCTGHRARAVHLLAITSARRFRHAIGSRQGAPGEVPEFLIQQPWSGGGEGKRRMREAREMYGVDYAHDRFEPADGVSSTMVYRLLSLGVVGGYGALPGASLIGSARAQGPAMVRFADRGQGTFDVPNLCLSEDEYRETLRSLWAAGELEFEVLCRQTLRRPTSDLFNPVPIVQQALEAIGLRWAGL
jgi:hypothetical protein